MKLENWLSSKKKYEKIVKGLSKDKVLWNRIDKLFKSGCGYCDEFRHCGGCPLCHKKVCGRLYADYAYWELLKAYRRKDKLKALPLAKQILAAIMEDEPK